MAQEERVRTTRPFPIVMSGPSGVGKTTLVDELTRLDPSLRSSISTTTRPPREGETEGVDYFFVDRAEFNKLKKGQLIEWAEVHGQSYGTPRNFVELGLAAGSDVILNIDVQGGIKVKKSFPDAVMIFIFPPSFEELKSRIEQRGKDYAAEIEKRLEAARGEIEHARDYDYIVVNDTLEHAVAVLRSIVEAERCRPERYDADFLERFGD
jgi:guanylate kinase